MRASNQIKRIRNTQLLFSFNLDKIKNYCLNAKQHNFTNRKPFKTRYSPYSEHIILKHWSKKCTTDSVKNDVKPRRGLERTDATLSDDSNNSNSITNRHRRRRLNTIAFAFFCIGTSASFQCRTYRTKSRFPAMIKTWRKSETYGLR